MVGGLALSVDPYGRLGYDSVVTVPASPMAAPRAPDTVQSGIDENSSEPRRKKGG